MAYTTGMGTGCLYKERGGVAYTKGMSTGCAYKERGGGVYEGRGVGGVYGGGAGVC